MEKGLRGLGQLPGEDVPSRMAAGYGGMVRRYGE
jgi:hypothetical protein